MDRTDKRHSPVRAAAGPGDASRRVFEEQVFRRAGRMNVPLLAEALRALDDHPDEEAAPRKELVWQKLGCRMAEEKRRPAVRVTRRGLALLAALLVLLMSGAAVAVIDWASVFQNAYRETGQREIRAADWPLAQKQSLVDALRAAGYDLSTLPALQGKSDEERDRLLTRWIDQQAGGEINDWLFNLLTRMKGIFDSWSLEDKAWYCQLLTSNHLAREGDFVSTVPEAYRQEAIDQLLSRAWAIAHEMYDDTAAEPDTWTASLFYGYVYPDEDTMYWRVHFRGEDLTNWLTVQADGESPLDGELTIVIRSQPPEDVG